MRSPLVSIFLIIGVFLAGTTSAQVYQYDALNRLQAANYADGSSIRYEYDANSNITRIRYQAAVVALPPEGVIDEPADDVSIETGESVTFEGSGTDPDGAVPLAFSWDFDGGAPDSTDEDPGPVTFNTAGTYTVELTVTDATGLADPTPDTVVVTVTDPATTPPPPPPPPPPAPGGGGAPAQDSGGGGSLLWLPVLLGLMLLTRSRRAIVLATLLLAGTVNAQNWIQMTSGTDANLNDVWMHSPTLAYAVGSGGTVLRYDGNVWTPVDTGVTANLNGVWGTDPNNIYIVGTMGTVLHYDGSTWTLIDIGADTTSLNDVWQEGPGTPVYVVGLRGVWEFNGTVWDRMIVDPPVGFGTLTPDVNITAVRGFGDVVVATADGQFGTDASLLVFHEPARRRFESINIWRGSGLVVFDANNIITAGESPRRLLNGTAANNADWGVGGFGFNGVWGTSHENVWALTRIGSSAEIRYRTEVGVRNDRPASERQLLVNFRQLNGIHGSDENNVMAVGSLGSIYAYLEPEGLPTAAKVPFSASTEDGVNLYTGEVVYETTDIALDTRMPMEFRRYYATRLWDQQTVGERLSENWTHNYEWRIDTGLGAANDQVRITDYRGREHLFQDEGGSFSLVSPTWANVGLSIVNGWYIFFDRSTGMRYAFGGTLNRLSWIEDRNGNRHALNYNSGYLVSITDGGSGVISLQYTANGKLERAYVEKSTTLETTFAYENGVMVSATSPSGEVTRYSYEDGRRLTSIELGSGTPDAVIEQTWEYEDERVVGTNVTGGGRFIYVYEENLTRVLQPDTGTVVHAHGPDGELLSTTSALGNETLYDYDSDERLAGVTDAAGRMTAWSYDNASGLIDSIVDPGGFETRYTYVPETVDDGSDFYDPDVITLPNGASMNIDADAAGNVTRISDELANTWTYDYSDMGDLIRSENPAGGVTTYDHFFDGNVRSILNPDGTEWLFSYDSFLRLEIEQYGRSSNYEYSTRFVPDRVIDRSGARFDYTYNGAGLVQRIDRSDGYFEEYDYEPSGRLASITINRTYTWRLEYDDFGRLSAVSDTSSRRNAYSYDEDGRVSVYQDFDGSTWGFAYHPDGQLASVTRPRGESAGLEYTDPRGLLSAIVNGIERFSFGYDARGNLATASDPRERVNNIERNLRGDPVSIADPTSNTERRFESDVLGNLVSYTDPLGGTERVEYGSDRLADSSTNALGQVTSYARDREGRIDTITYADGSEVAVEYAQSGLPSRISGSDGSDIAIDSTPAGRIVGGTDLQVGYSQSGKVNDSNGLQILYNDDDRVRRIVFADGRHVDYEYNDRGDVVLVRDWAGGETLIQPTDVGKIDLLTYPNGIVTDYEYDRAERITSIGMGSLGTITVSRDVFGRIESTDKASLNIAVNMPNEDRNFAYNLASQIEAGVYDAKGNLIRRAGTLMTWDAANRISRIEEGSEQIVVSYDALGGVTRLSQSSGDGVYVQNYALRKPRISIERDSAGNDLWYYVHTFEGRLLYRISATGGSPIRQFYHFDESGNTILLTSDSGAVIQSYVVAPHGEVITQNGNIDNLNVTGAENGGMQLGTSDIVKVGTTFVDVEAGHAANTDPLPEIADKARPQLNDFGDGRSVRPGTGIMESETGNQITSGFVGALLATTAKVYSTAVFADTALSLSGFDPLFFRADQPQPEEIGSVFLGAIAIGVRASATRSYMAVVAGNTALGLSGFGRIQFADRQTADSAAVENGADILKELPKRRRSLSTNPMLKDAAALYEAIIYIFDPKTPGDQLTRIAPPGFTPPPNRPVVDSILKEVAKDLILL